MNDNAEKRPHIGMSEDEPATPAELESAGQGVLLPVEALIAEHPPAEMLASVPAAAQPLEVIDPNVAARAHERATAPPPVMIEPDPAPLAMLASALAAGHDIEKLGGLMDLAERYEANQARKSFAAALSKFQGSVPDIIEGKLATVTMQQGGSYTYSYADLDTIMKAIRPTLKKCGLSVRYDAEVSDDGKRIRSTCYVMHRDGHTEATTFVCPLDDKMKVNDSQKMGSANSYACRYNACNALGLTTGEDDDAGALHGDKRRTGDNKQSSATAQPTPQNDLEEICPIGKHKGCRWQEVPLDYLEWMVANLTDKDDIVAKARRVMDGRIDSQNTTQQDEAGDEGELTMAECARTITNATHATKLAEFWQIVPDKHRAGLQPFYDTRRNELMGNDDRGKRPVEDDDVPF